MFQVSGVSASEIAVEIQVGSFSQPEEPIWVPFYSDRNRAEGSSDAAAETTYVPIFDFTQPQGRIPTITATTSENPTDQFDVFINIYKKTLLGGEDPGGVCEEEAL